MKHDVMKNQTYNFQANLTKHTLLEINRNKLLTGWVAIWGGWGFSHVPLCLKCRLYLSFLINCLDCHSLLNNRKIFSELLLIRIAYCPI